MTITVHISDDRDDPGALPPRERGETREFDLQEDLKSGKQAADAKVTSNCYVVTEGREQECPWVMVHHWDAGGPHVQAHGVSRHIQEARFGKAGTLCQK